MSAPYKVAFCSKVEGSDILQNIVEALFEDLDKGRIEVATQNVLSLLNCISYRIEYR